jgi:hypothetical protein
LIPRLGYTNEVDFTIVNGEVVFRDGELTRVNEAELKQQADKSQQRINLIIDQEV